MLLLLLILLLQLYYYYASTSMLRRRIGSWKPSVSDGPEDGVFVRCDVVSGLSGADVNFCLEIELTLISSDFWSKSWSPVHFTSLIRFTSLKSLTDVSPWTYFGATFLAGENWPIHRFLIGLLKVGSIDVCRKTHLKATT